MFYKKMILVCFFIAFSVNIFATMPSECPVDCVNNGYFCLPCPSPYGGSGGAGAGGGATGATNGSGGGGDIMSRNYTASPPSPMQGAAGSDSFSRRATLPVAGNSVLQDMHIAKQWMIQGEKIIKLDTKGYLPLEINLYYSARRSDYSANISGHTFIGPGWVLNHEMRLFQITDSDDLCFQTSVGDLQRLVNIETNKWKSRWFWLPITVTVEKIENHPDYGTYYKMLFDDNKTEYGFKEFGKMFYQKDADGNMLTFHYDTLYNKLLRIKISHETNDTDDRFVSFNYISYQPDLTIYNRISEIISSDGRRWILEYDDSDNYRLIRIKYKRHTNDTATTLREYDYSDNTYYAITQVRAIRGDGTFGTVANYNLENNLHVTSKTDSYSNQLLTVDYSWGDATVNFASGSMTKVFNEPQKQTKKFEYYVNDTLKATQEYSYVNSPEWYAPIETQFTESHTDAAGNITTYEYDGPEVPFSDDPTYQEKCLDFAHTRIKKINYPDNSYITYTYDVNGNVTSHRDKRGKIWNYSYDSNNHMTSRTDPLNNTVTFTYNSFGMLSSITQPGNLTTTFQYDDYGQLITKTEPGNLNTVYSYDNYGNVTSVKDHNNRTTLFENYNGFGQPQLIRDSEDNITNINYNDAGLKTYVHDAEGKSITYNYDKNYRLVQIMVNLDESVYFTYDDRGNLVTFTDEEGHQTTYTYDEFNNLISETDEYNHVTSYAYNYDGGCSSCGDLGALISKTDPMGQITSFEYDVNGRIDKILYPASQYVQFTYDNNGNKLSMFDTRLNVGNETFSWQYDDLNRVTRETYPDGNYLEYGYNNLGARTSMRLPSGHTQTYNYDARARLSSILHSLGNRTFSYSYNTSDETLQMITYPNSIQNVFSYNSLYRPSNITATPLGTGVIHYSVDYTYDDVGNKTRAGWYSDVSPVLNYVKNYQYDNRHQLTLEAKWNPDETVKEYEYSYTFDDAGNRTSMGYYENGQGTVTTTYLNNNINQLTDRFVGGDEFNYSYDLNGNMIEEYNLGNSRTFTWNQDNRLIEVDDDINGGHVQYVYDAVGRRLIRKDLDSGVWTKYYYDGLTVVAEMQSTDGGQNWSWKRVMSTGPGVIGNIFSISIYNSTSWVNEYLHYDAIGNVVMKTDDSSYPLAAFDQEAYGIVKDGAQSGYHLTTKEYDTASDLYYFWQRWYDPEVGRFVSKDFLRDSNRYRYSLNNPLNYIDPDGLKVIYAEYDDEDYCKDGCERLGSACRRRSAAIYGSELAEYARVRSIGDPIHRILVTIICSPLGPAGSIVGLLTCEAPQRAGQSYNEDQAYWAKKCRDSECNEEEERCKRGCSSGYLRFDPPTFME